MEVKEESEKVGLKLNIHKTKIMASGPVTSCKWGKVETMTDLIFLGSKITMDSDCSHVIKRCLFPGRKAMTNLDKIIKSRDITEHQRIDAFELWCWRRLKSPLDCKEIHPVDPKGDQSWVFIGRTDAEAPILWPPAAKSQLIGKDPDGWERQSAGEGDDRG